MIEIHGEYNTAKVFTDELEAGSREQIENLCNQPFVEGYKIRLMPDVHAGAGCTIGTTMTIKDKIVPNLVGVDIGCGMETIVINNNTKESENFDPARLDEIIHREIPNGMHVRRDPHEFISQINLDEIRCPSINKRYAQKSLGTLGGGNHFIEANRDDKNNLYIVIHSGSRHLGKEVAEYYQEQAWRQLNGNSKADINNIIVKLKAEGHAEEIQDAVQKIKAQILTSIPKDLAYVCGELFDDYMNDMKITQYFALINRKAMMSTILKGLDIANEGQFEQFSTIHNYIDTESMILRKGAVSAKKGEKIIVPINMRDGSIICEGLGNADWNYSAPHGAGRVMSRQKAFKTLMMEDYKKEMEGIYSTSVNALTIDESPMAYKSMNNIVANIEPTAKILSIIKPIYNFKAAEVRNRWTKRRL
ncbi:MAG: RtcB family protein [Spirochaetaceae bacterium]|jgi:RNA-splicing ligase RtcB|nr:RtcB family protein [Spirochaetaceae bacterium]